MLHDIQISTSLPGLHGMLPKQHANCKNEPRRLRIYNAVTELRAIFIYIWIMSIIRKNIKYCSQNQQLMGSMQ